MDELKSTFLDNSTDAATLLHLRIQLDELEETTPYHIETSLITSFKRSILEQQLDNSKNDTDTWKLYGEKSDWWIAQILVDKEMLKCLIAI